MDNLKYLITTTASYAEQIPHTLKNQLSWFSQGNKKEFAFLPSNHLRASVLELRCHSLNPLSPDSSGVLLPNKLSLLHNYMHFIALVWKCDQNLRSASSLTRILALFTTGFVHVWCYLTVSDRCKDQVSDQAVQMASFFVILKNDFELKNPG